MKPDERIAAQSPLGVSSDSASINEYSVALLSEDSRAFVFIRG
jgi:hypothetical protein